MEMMDMLKRTPAWIIAAMLVAFLFVFIERTYISEKPFLIADMKFGPVAETRGSPAFPPGTIIAWDPVQRSIDGTVPELLREIPDGWVLCDGSRGTPILTDHVLQGVGTISNAGDASRQLLAAPMGGVASDGTVADWGTGDCPDSGCFEGVSTYKVQFLCNGSEP